ncbi:endonuclease/exonuclease/phosphatase family protein [Entamoeba histolytica]
MNNPLHRQTIKILTYNIYCRPPGITSRGNDYKKERLMTFCDEELNKYDIVAFQELFGAFSSKRRIFIEKAKQQGFVYEAHLERPKWPIYPVDGGVCILSRFPIVSQHQKIYTRGCYSDGASAKGVIHTKIDIGFGKEIHLFSTHLQADYYESREDNAKSRRHRNTQINECLHFINECTAYDNDPIIFEGDLNIKGGTKEYDDFLTTLHSNEFDIEAHDFLFEDKKVHPITHSEVIDGEQVDTVITSKVPAPINARLDYIWGIKNGRERKELKAIQTNVCKFQTTNKPFPYMSDHYGVEVTLELL